MRHFYNVRHQGLPSPWWTWGLAALCALLVVWLSALGPADGGAVRAKRAEAPGPPPIATPVAFQQVDDIVTSRCSMCHAAEPVWAGIASAPKGVLLDTPDRIRSQAREIAVGAAWSSAMPPSNVTGLTERERAILAAWARQPRP